MHARGSARGRRGHLLGDLGRAPAEQRDDARTQRALAVHADLEGKRRADDVLDLRWSGWQANARDDKAIT